MTNSKEKGADKSTFEEKRVHPRIVCSETTFYSTDDAVYEGLIKDIGAKGIYVASRNPVEVGEIITIAIPSPGNKTGEKIKGEVIWKKPGGFGVRFSSHVLKVTVTSV